MANVLWMSGFILLCLLAYRFLLPRLRRFDDAGVPVNVADGAG